MLEDPKEGLTKLCRECGNETLYPDGFGKGAVGKRTTKCKSCHSKRSSEWARNNPERCLENRRNAAYNIDFNERWSAQGGLCASCAEPMLPRGKEPMSVVVDHDRNCCLGHGSCGKCVRGLVHNRCNRVIGNANDDVHVLESAVAYLKRWRDRLI